MYWGLLAADSQTVSCGGTQRAASGWAQPAHPPPSPSHARPQAAAHDAFTARLLRLLRDSRPARSRWAGAAPVLGVHRSDYMLDAPSGGFLQARALRSRRLCLRVSKPGACARS